DSPPNPRAKTRSPGRRHNRTTSTAGSPAKTGIRLDIRKMDPNLLVYKITLKRPSDDVRSTAPASRRGRASFLRLATSLGAPPTPRPRPTQPLGPPRPPRPPDHPPPP